MDRAEKVRQILSTRSLSLYRVSRQSAELFGRSSRFHIPQNLYHDVADRSLLPTIHQMLALSRITDYRLHDWLKVFGFDVDRIVQLRLLIPRQRTTLLDSSVYDPDAWISWFAERPRRGLVPPIAPLGQLLECGMPRRAAEVLNLGRRRFLYGVVGEGDVQAFPRLAPGSIFRVDELRSKDLLSDRKHRADTHCFLVEHGSGFSCSQLVVLEKDRIMLPSPQNPCEQTELTLGKDVRIIGVVDAEVRPVGHRPGPRSPNRSVRPPEPSPPHPQNIQASLRHLLTSSRLRSGLSFREASAISQKISSTFSDELYFAAPSTLSDYETLSAPPRHIQKIITLCVLYCIGFQEFLLACALPLEQAGREPIPDELVPREATIRNSRVEASVSRQGLEQHGGFLDSLIEPWDEVPLFLRHSMDELTNLKNFTFSDVYWVGGDEAPIHPWLQHATFIAVNRRIKRPGTHSAKTGCDLPLCLIFKRDGNYLCGRCHSQENKLIVSSCPGSAFGTREFKTGIDAEVVGQVTAILRRLP